MAGNTVTSRNTVTNGNSDTMGGALLLVTVATLATWMAVGQGPQASLFLEETRLKIRRIGSSYGGWTFRPDLLNNASIVYSFGLGSDISWDSQLIGAIGCEVHGFDNTPVSNKYLEKQLAGDRLPPGFLWHKFLLSDHDGVVEMMLPTGHSASYAETTTGQATGFKANSAHTARGYTIGSIMRKLNHTRIDVLKMDIESSEFKIFNAILNNGPDTVPPVHRLPVCQLLVEFHSRLSPKGYASKAQTLLSLHTLGFELVHNVVQRDSADNAMFVNFRFCSSATLLTPT